MFSKMHKSIRKDLESKVTLVLLEILLSINFAYCFEVCIDVLYALLQALMKSFTATSSDPEKPERFLGYMVPSTEEVDLTRLAIFKWQSCLHLTRYNQLTLLTITC